MAKTVDVSLERLEEIKKEKEQKENPKPKSSKKKSSKKATVKAVKAKDGFETAPKASDVKKAVDKAMEKTAEKQLKENKEALTAAETALMKRVRAEILKAEKAAKKAEAEAKKAEREAKRKEDQERKAKEKAEKERLKKEREERQRQERLKKAEEREKKRIASELKRKMYLKEYSKRREPLRMIMTESELYNEHGKKKHQKMDKDIKDQQRWKRMDARDENQLQTGGRIDDEGNIVGGFRLKTKEQYEANMKALRDFNRKIDDWADNMYSQASRRRNIPESEREMYHNRYLGIDMEVMAKWGSGNDLPNTNVLSQYFLEKLFSESKALSRRGVTPKVAMKLVDDTTGETDFLRTERVAYQILNTIVLNQDFSNKAYMYAVVAATYFQLLVSNTPVDEPYRYTIDKRVNTTDIKKKYRVNMTEERLKEIEDMKAEAERNRGKRTVSHKPDNDSARGDWILHYKGQEFKAYTTDNGQGSFSEEDFIVKGDTEAIYRIAKHLYLTTKGNGVSSYSFNCTTMNRHVQYLEYGGYKGESEPIVGTGKYKFKHGVSKGRVYQAPHGFVRLVNAAWNYYAEELLSDVEREFDEKELKIDVSTFTKRKAMNLLKKGGMPTIEECDRAFLYNIENEEFDF